MPTKEELKSQLAQMGLDPAGTVLIHTSLKVVGRVEGGPDAFLDAFCEYFRDGLFIVPTHTWATVTPMQPVYDVRASVPCIGLVPRTAARRADGVRSLHPTHSVWAHGPRAEEFARGEEKLATPTPANGCWGRLFDERAKILLIGVGHERDTYIHSIDERLNIPDRLADESFESVIIDRDGRRLTGNMRIMHCSKCADVSLNFVNFEKPLIAAGAQTFGRLGDAKVRVVDAVKCTEVVAGLWRKADYDLCGAVREIPPEYYR